MEHKAKFSIHRFNVVLLVTLMVCINFVDISFSNWLCSTSEEYGLL